MESRENKGSAEQKENGNDGENEWIVYEQEDYIEPERILREERTIILENCTNTPTRNRKRGGSGSSGGNSLMMSSYLNIHTTSSPQNLEEFHSVSSPQLVIMPSSSSSTSEGDEHPVPPISAVNRDSDGNNDGNDGNNDNNDNNGDPEENYLPSTSALAVDVKEPSPNSEINSFSPQLKSEIILSPHEHQKTQQTGSDHAHDYPPAHNQENLPTSSESYERNPTENPQELEWWRRLNGYGLAALVVGTASIVAYSMARHK